MDRSKDAVADRLAQAHYAIEPSIERIVRVEASAGEDRGDEPIKLLEVNSQTTASGIVPVFFGPDVPSGIIYPSVIIEVTPEEFEAIRHRPAQLPNGWRLGRSIDRLPSAKVG